MKDLNNIENQEDLEHVKDDLQAIQSNEDKVEPLQQDSVLQPNTSPSSFEEHPFNNDGDSNIIDTATNQTKPISHEVEPSIKDCTTSSTQLQQDVLPSEESVIKAQKAILEEVDKAVSNDDAALANTPLETIEVEVVSEDTQQKPKHGKASKKIKKPPFINRHKTGCILTGCLLLSITGGFGGTYAANLFSNNDKVVLNEATDGGNKQNSSSASNMSVKDVANKTMNSVVEIKTETAATNEYLQQAVQSGAGSGVILSEDGYIVTNNHVIEGANKITVNTKDGKSYTGKLIGTDASTDLAIIKIEATGLSPATLGKSSALSVGDTAIAIGNPLGELGGTVTSGIISALDREITINNETMHLLQTNAAINPGNSGGGLFNASGELIGIVNAKSSGSDIEGLGFAIPIDRAKDIITNLINNGYVKGRASLGVTLKAVENSNPFSQENGTAIYIAEISKGKAADKAGLEVGDQILKVDNKEVRSIADIKTAISAKKAGDSISITVLRNQETKTIQVTLGEATGTTNPEEPEK